MSKLLDIKKRIKKKKNEDKYNAPMIIRDSRESGFYITDNIFFDEYVVVCGLNAFGVYGALCRHAGKDQTCYPSVGLMSVRLGISRGYVLRGLKTLEEHRIIRIDRQKGQPNIYTLLNKRQWRKFITVKTEEVNVGKFLSKACIGCENQETPACDGCVGGSKASHAQPNATGN